MEQILEQWDRAAETCRTTQASSPDARWNRELAARRFSDFTGQTVLDAGCGCGEYTEQFRCAGARVVGCDGSAEMLRLARERFPLCEFRQSDLLGPLPFSDGQFDLAFCNQVLMDLPEIRGLLGEFHRVVREGGILFFGIVHPMVYPGEWVEDAGVKTRQGAAQLCPALPPGAPLLRRHHPFSPQRLLVSQSGGGVRVPPDPPGGAVRPVGAGRVRHSAVFIRGISKAISAVRRQAWNSTFSASRRSTNW
jgi:SAM-dependent methyltransferase